MNCSCDISKSLRVARNDFEISQEQFTLRVTEVLGRVLETYWDLVFLLQDIEVRQQSLELAELILQHNRIQVAEGALAPLEEIEAEAEVARRQEQLITAVHDRNIVEDRLKMLLTGEVDPGSILARIEPASTPEISPPAPGSVEDAVQRAFELRPEIKQLLLELENREIQTAYTRNQLRPSLDLVASYSMNGLGGLRLTRDFSGGFVNAPVLDVKRGGFLDSLDSLSSGRFLGYSVGISLTMPIGNEAARADSARAQIALRQGEEELRALRQEISIEVRDAYGRMERDLARVQAARASVRYEAERLRGEQDRFELGAATTRLVLEAQRDSQEASLLLLRARLDLVKSRIDAHRAVGNLLSVYNIEVEEALDLPEHGARPRG